MNAFWGVYPYHIEHTKNTDEMIIEGENLLKDKKLIKKGDKVIIISGINPRKGATNMLKLSKI
jgi:pyruvate kinase